MNEAHFHSLKTEENSQIPLCDSARHCEIE